MNECTLLRRHAVLIMTLITGGPKLTGSKQPTRGSLSQAQLQSISQPRRSSSNSLSAFQTLARGSDPQLSPEVVPQTSNRPYIIATIALLFGVVAVLAFLLVL